MSIRSKQTGADVSIEICRCCRAVNLVSHHRELVVNSETKWQPVQLKLPEIVRLVTGEEPLASTANSFHE